MRLAWSNKISYRATIMGVYDDSRVSAFGHLSVYQADMPTRHDHKQRLRRTGLTVAALAFLLQIVSWAWAPAQAAVNGPDGEIIICTADGLVKFTPDRRGDNAATDHGCPLCPLVSGLALPPQPSLLSVPVRLIRLQAAALPGAQISVGWFLATFQARAPPPIG